VLARVIAEPAYAQSPLLGFAYRFYEITEENDACIEMLQTSIAWFKRFGMEKSLASSQAAAAVLLARTGDIDAARSMISSASEILGQQVRGRHLLLNNVAAVELLSSEPDFQRCVDVLVEALRYVRDDYCEVTVLTNLAIAHCGAGHSEAAIECIDSALCILDDHDFASVDVYWQICFNAAQILAAVGQPERSGQVLRWPEGRAPMPVQNKDYWDYRYRRTDDLPKSWRFLAERSFHPLYLSLWLIDLEGLNLVRPAPLR
jgi:ATP/maltotriose-dependent transcriptional regulator MalT